MLMNPIAQLWGSWMVVSQFAWLAVIPIAAVIYLINTIRKTK